LTGAQATATQQEQDRLREQGEKRMQEALARSRTPGYQDPEVLGSILAGMAGAKRLGEGLAGAGAGAGKAMAARREELRKAEERFDLNKGELFRLEGLRNQVLVQQQQLDLANATGNKALADKTAMDLALSKEALAKAELEVREKVQKAGIERYVAESQRMGARAQMIQAGKPSEVQSREDLYRRDPKAYEAMYGAKESMAVANLVRAVNSDPALKSLSEALKLASTPEAQAKYDARYKQLVTMYAPELLLGGGGAGGGSARAAADAILKGE
jgi:hypothetical protein